MPGWLVRRNRVRAFELVIEFLRLARRATPEEYFRQGCETLRELFEAEAVSLWRLESSRHCLQPVAASAPEWEFFGELSLDSFPDLRQALAEPTPLWIEQVAARWQPLPPPLLEADSVLVLPVAASNRTHGCVLGLFGKAAPAPTPEELEAGLALAYGLGEMLEAEILRQQLGALSHRQDSRRRLAGELQRLGFSEVGLNRLAAAALELEDAEAAALYERHPEGFRRLAAAGSIHLLPPELPLGESRVLPWQRALEEARTVEVEPEELATTLQPWLPELARAAFSLRVLPLQTSDGPLGVLLLCGAPARPTARREEPEWAELSLLSAAALELARRRRLQEQTQSRYQALFDQAQEGVFFLDAAGRILAPNRPLLQWTGYSQEELQVRPLAEFLHPADWEAVSVWLQSRPERFLQRGARWRVKSGAWWPSELTLHLVSEPAAEETPVLVLVRDSAREREAEARARVNEARLQGLLDSVHDGVWVIAADGTVEFANHRLGQLFGVNAQQLGPGLAQREVLERLQTKFQSPEAVLARWQQLQANPEEVCWDELELREPRRRVLERFSRPLFDTQHQLVGRLEVYRDITAQRLLEDKILQREKLVAVGQLVSGIAHELNNPLTAVAGYAQLVLAARLSPELRGQAERLAREAERAGHIVKNLLLFARGAKAEKQTVDLAEILERTLSLRAYELKVANIQVVRDYAPQLPSVLADPHQLQQVFFNLLLNAEQAIRSLRDHGRITVRTRGRPDGSRARGEIADDGPGISAAHLSHLFDPFFSTKPPEEGTGLGLSISQAIVKEHGGEIFVHSAPGEGATFAVELPTLAVETPAPEPRPAAPPARAVEKRSRRILVVDDEPAVAHLIADALEQQGYAVRVHTDSRRAMAEAFEHPFQLAICDIRMPELDGQAFYRALREHQSPLARRLLFTTGDTLARETAKFLEQVGLPYLAKPFRVEELRAVVRDLLQKLDGATPGEKEVATA